MKAFIDYVVRGLVDYPDEVEITEVDRDRVIVFELRMNKSDIGKVIGRSGRTITAIRSLLTSAAAKQGKRAMVEIIEPDRDPRNQPPEATAETEVETESPTEAFREGEG